MFGYLLAFDSPWWLLLLLVLPILWWASYRTLSGLGSLRRWAAIGLRTLVLVLMILALAELQWVRTSDRLTVLYLLDQSLSVPQEKRRMMIDYVNESIKVHRDRDKEDRAGVIVFGKDAAVEIPPVEENVPVSMTIESLLDPEYTDLAGAMKLALALFPHDAAKRVVVVTDGNENLGDAMAEARSLAESGVSIDVVPISVTAEGEVAVEKVTVPSNVRRGQPFDVRVVMNNTTEPTATSSGVVRGKLVLTRRVGENIETLDEQSVELPPGKRVLTIREEIESPDFYKYEARFFADNPAADAVLQNNRATTFTHVRGRGNVLLVEDWTREGPNYLADALKRENIEVTIQYSNELFKSLGELQRYDAVLLNDVPRTSGDDADQISNFSDAQIAMLVRNTQQMGAGLVMIGGPNSFGAGGWANTELEEAMPVDFEIKNAKVVPSGALALVIDKSGSMAGPKNEMSRRAAIEAIKVLSSKDYVGVMAFDGAPQWIVPMTKAEDRKAIARRVSRLFASGGTDMYPAMVQAYAALRQVKASVKHMIVLTDGHTPPAGFVELTRKMRAADIGVSAVAVGGDADNQLLSKIAMEGAGKFYRVNSPRAIPKIFIKEAMRVARRLVYEPEAPLSPQLVYPHEMLQGFQEPLPPVTGFVLTTVKPSPLVEVSLRSPQPANQENATLLASWNYGSGKSVALTTDDGRSWANRWTSDEGYSRLFGQIVRWAMRPAEGAGNFTIATDIENGRGRVIVTALDKDDEILNFLPISGGVVGPDMKPRDVNMRQVAPGRYVGDFEADEAGSYFVVVSPGEGMAPIRAGLNVPYSEEFRDRGSNRPLLETLAALQPQGGKQGQVIEVSTDPTSPEVHAAFNPFRRDFPKSTTSQDIWHLLLFAACLLFFLDVFNRRVQVSFAWLQPVYQRVADLVLRREPAVATSETMGRLQSRKAQIGGQIAQSRASARFEPVPDAPPDTSAIDESTGDVVPAATRPHTSTAPGQQLTPQQEEASYTERLLKAKKKVWDERKNNDQ